MAHEPYPLDVLWDLLAVDSPSGDEDRLADWLAPFLAATMPDVLVTRLGDSLLAVRGEQPKVAIFAHMDTTGFTLGYGKQLIPIGGPEPRDDEPIREIGATGGDIKLRFKDGGRSWKLAGAPGAEPGSRWVYAAQPCMDGDLIVSPYLDNRGGVWAALSVLRQCPRVAIAFTTSEEIGGRGAYVCARRLHDEHGIEQALIADLTWHTADIRCGQGCAISLRDRTVPRRRFIDRVLALAQASGIPFQREIESGGSSDGASLDRSGVPISWAFVGAPQKKPHSAMEQVHVDDLRGMAALLAYLTDNLTPAPAGPD